ncbi:MAG: glycosyltransferase [Candidatus Pacebacteria bacterium]|nr:glycosyltransferase [Candidatus Paceibacterota bacterium]
MTSTAIIPALNEEKTIGAVILAAKQSSNISEIIIVDDGSKDDTFKVASGFSVKVLQHKHNRGKAQAIKTGIEQSSSPVFIFIDADLIGITGIQLDGLLLPVINKEADMVIGKIDRRNRFSETPKIYKHQAHLSGTRVITKEFWDSIPKIYKKHYFLESALSYIAKKRGMRVKEVLLENVSHVIKEEKYGLPKGFFSRLSMFVQLGIIFILLRIKKQ